MVGKSRAVAGQEPVWKDGFLFVGNDIVLDFINTQPILDGQPTELIPDFDALMRWFHAARLLNGFQVARLQRESGASARGMVEQIHRLREDLRKAIIRWESSGGIDIPTMHILNRLLSAHPMRARLKRNDRKFSTELYSDPKTPEDLMAPLAHNAAMLFVNADRERVRQCDHCVLHFLDISKKGTRRWCNMQLCGNRLKVAAYAERKRAKSESARKM
jgi:predicted RNA-binding Zn ribbon-like protein